MRDIKFRGYNETYGWRYGYYADIRFEDGPMINHDGYWFGVEEETIGQYTGLKDKNGVEIYEGDTVQFVDSPEDGNGKIVWSEESAMFEILFDGIITCFDNEYGHDLEVIGNIHTKE